MAKSHPRASAAPSARPQSGSNPAEGLAARLLRSVQRGATLGLGAGARRAAGLGEVSERAASLQFLRVNVETMAAICADALRQCDRAIGESDKTAQAAVIARVEERARDLIAAGARTVIPEHPPLTRGAWMLTFTLEDDEALSARIPGLRAVAALSGVLTNSRPTARDHLDDLQTGLNAVRVQIRDTRIALLGLLENLSEALDA